MFENRASFFARIAFLAPSERFLVRKAYDISKATHRKQCRKEIVDGRQVRYFEHPRSVALILIDELHVVEPEILALALLHDVLEDADVSADVSPEYIEYLFGKSMVRRVLLLSKTWPNVDPAQKAEIKASYARRLAENGDIETLLVKACDRLHNLRTLCCDGTTATFIKKQCAETREVYLPLFEKMMDCESDHTRQLRPSIRDAHVLGLLLTMIRNELGRCERFLDERQQLEECRTSEPAKQPQPGSDAPDDEDIGPVPCTDRD